jgi:hypothetical protein
MISMGSQSSFLMDHPEYAGKLPRVHASISKSENPGHIPSRMTESTVLDWRDGRYEIVVQMASSLQKSELNLPGCFTTKENRQESMYQPQSMPLLRIWLTRLSCNALIKVKEIISTKASWYGEYTTECRFFIFARLASLDPKF